MAELTYPGGQVVKVEFDEIAHLYQVSHKLTDGWTDPRPTHGITEPLKVFPKPYLKAWAAKMATNATLDYFSEHPETVDKLPQFFQDLSDYENVTLDENGKNVMTYYQY